MKRTGHVLWLVVVGMLLTPRVQATPPPIAQVEISYLLTQVATSPCEFNRNGRWYGGKQAAAHLRDKYGSPFVLGHVDSAEDFIAKVATRSSFTGVEYAIRCNGMVTVSSALWLGDRLAAYRQASKGPPGS